MPSSSILGRGRSSTFAFTLLTFAMAFAQSTAPAGKTASPQGTTATPPRAGDVIGPVATIRSPGENYKFPNGQTYHYTVEIGRASCRERVYVLV